MKRFAKYGGAALAVVVVAALVVPFFIPKSVYLTKVTEYIESTFFVKCEIGDAHIRILPRPTIVLEGVQATQMNSPSGLIDPFFTVTSLSLGAEWAPLMRRTIELHVSVDHPSLRLIGTADGGWEVASLGGESKKEEDASPSGWIVVPSALTIDEMKVALEPKRGEWATYQGINLDVTTRSYTAEELVMKIAASVTVAGKSPVTVSVSAPTLRVAMATKEVSFPSATLTAMGVPIDLSGSIVGGDVPKVDMVIRYDGREMDKVAALVEPAGMLKGKVSVEVAVKGALDRLAGDGKLAVERVELTDTTIHDLKAALAYKDKKLTLTSLTSRIWDGNISGSAVINLTEPVRYHFAIDGEDVALEQMHRLDGRVTGKASLTMEGDGVGPEWDKTLDATGHFATRDVTIPKLATFEKVTQSKVWEGVMARAGLIDTAAVQQLSKVDPEVRDLKGRFTIEKGVLKLPTLNWQRGEEWLSLAGGIGLDRHLDLAGQLKLSETLLKKWIKNEKLRNTLLDANRQLALPLTVSGEMASPDVAIDMAPVQVGIKSFLADEVKSSLVPAGLTEKREEKREEVKEKVNNAIDSLKNVFKR